LQNDVVQDSTFMEGKRLITFASILKHGSFPIAKIIKDILDIGKKEMNNHIEIEFAMEFDTPYEKPVFNILQIRPVNFTKKGKRYEIDSRKIKESVIYSTSALGNGYYGGISKIVYIKKDAFDPSKNMKLAAKVEKTNDQLGTENENYLLIGPGRWGSTDPWLGIPVAWSQVSEASVIVEYHIEGYNVEPSQGTHFFHNLVQFGIGYLTIGNSPLHEKIDFTFLERQRAEFEDEDIKVIKLKNDLEIGIDGRNGTGIVFCPEKKNDI
jgi:hypothetical protein